MRLALVLLLAFLPQPTQSADCWHNFGMQSEFGSLEQGKELQRLVRSSECTLLAIQWQISTMPSRNSVMVWDQGNGTLVRIHVQGSARWEQWFGATKQAVFSEDLDDGLDFLNYLWGQGKAPLKDAAKAFVREHGGGRFNAAL